MILESVFDFLQQTIDSLYDIRLLLISIFFFILFVNYVLYHFQRLSGFVSIKTILKTIFWVELNELKFFQNNKTTNKLMKI